MRNNKINLGILLVITVQLFACGSSSEDDISTPEPSPSAVPQVTPAPQITPTMVVTSPPLSHATPSPEVTPSPLATSTPNAVMTQPNILFILTDDQGLDASAQYALSTDVPVTPTLDALASNGVIFDNAWATPACTTTRATILTGKFGTNSGVTYVPATLTNEHTIIQKHLKGNDLTSNYKSGVFGKWHVGGGSAEESHPNDLGVDYYAGNLGNLDDYYNWTLTINGQSSNSTEYHSSKLTDLAIDWIAAQNTPWFAWLAFSAPHDPYHLPPEALHSRDLPGTAEDITNNKRDYYLASIEAMDSEISRLLASMDEATIANTLIIFLGDNGTPKGVIDPASYERTHGKGSLYQGGIAVPLFVSGKGVSRTNDREDALVTATDLFATIAQAAGINDSDINDSHSFYSLLSDDEQDGSRYVYTEFKTSANAETGWSVRSATHKLIEHEDGSQALYELTANFYEINNLLPSSDSNVLALVDSLTSAGESFLNIVPDENAVIDITNKNLTNSSGNCADYVNSFSSTVNDIHNSQEFMGSLVITIDGNKCVFTTNAIPNHDFNDGSQKFPNDVSAQNVQLEVTSSPSKAQSVTPLSLRVDNALLLNGVKVDLLAAGCFGVGNGKVGCNDGNDWRYDPMHLPNGFNVDTHNAHAQPNGTYHYHGSPFALFEENGDKISPVIGFAADGFPIFGSYFNDGNTIRKALPSYQLRSGQRSSASGDPGGSYNGEYRDDYEYIEALGDLDECNGMTVNGVYGYYVTDEFPYVLACFTGTPDSSFNK